MSPFNYAKGERTREKQPISVAQKPLLKPGMVKNSDDCFVFKTEDKKQLERFLILGSEGSTYYASAQKLTESNTKNIVRMIQRSPEECLETILDVSHEGRAPKNDPAIFALSLFFKYADREYKTMASRAANRVLRTFTHLATFMSFVDQFHGQGRSVRRVMTNWYTEKSPEQILFQYTKYGKRNGWAHKDIVHLAHIRPTCEKMQALFAHMFEKINDDELASAIPQYQTNIDLKNASDLNQVIRTLKSNPRAQWEHLPTEYLRSARVWKQLVPNLGMTALIRNLGRISSLGCTDTAFSDITKTIIRRLTSKDELKRARIHPINVLNAWKTYSNGRGIKGSLSWRPNESIINALENAYRQSFVNAPVTGKNFFIGVDISGSMSWGNISGSHLTPMEAAAVLAHERVVKEEWTEVVGFSHYLKPINMTPNDSLSDALGKTVCGNFGSTNPGLLIEEAMRKRYPVDVFIMITDNEVNHGKHPWMLLKKFRQTVNPKAKLVVIGMTATDCSIADPNDSGMLDIVGFDTNIPALISDFAMD